MNEFFGKVSLGEVEKGGVNGGKGIENGRERDRKGKKQKRRV
jgi:hypothetical protein